MLRLINRVRVLALFLLLSNFTTAAPVCPAGTAVAYFRLEARRATAPYAIPIDRVNQLYKGDTIVFFPSDPPVPMDVSSARVALLFLTPRTGELRLLETKKGNSRQEWVLPEDAAAIAVAYGPKGLNEDKVKSETTRDPELIAQLAEYSEKTAQTEIVLSALTGRRQNDDRAVEAALQGLASTGGAAKLDRTASLDQQTMSLFRTLNPAIGAYDPLAPEPQQRWQQSAMLATSVAGLFFGNTVGLAGGGAALFLNMRSLMFPRTELRSALLREAPEPALCAAKTASSRTKFAYLWARRLPAGQAPLLEMPKTAHLAIGLPATIPVEAPDTELTTAGRTFRWKLVGEKGVVPLPVAVPVNEKSLRIAEVPANAKPGRYRLMADWDWTSVQVGGDVELHPLPDLRELRLTPDSADRLVINAGPVRARLAGARTYFVNGMQLLKLGDPLAKPMPVSFAPGPAGDWVEFELNTSHLAQGAYALTVSQQGGAKNEIPLRVQQPAPALANLPIAVHQGEPETVVLSGNGLDRIEKITSKYARIDWDAANRQARVTLDAKAPAAVDIEAHVEGRVRPLQIASAIRVLGPKPEITDMTRAPQQAGDVERRDGEIDVALPAAFSLKVQNLAPGAKVSLACKEPGLSVAPVEAKAIGTDALYFTIPAGGATGCSMTARVSGSNEVSLGKTVALPAITGFTLSDEKGEAPDTFKGALLGQGLEGIGATGWVAGTSRDVTSLPVPEGTGQKLEIAMPWPSPAPRAPLRIWLRGETEPRLTTVRY